MVEEEGVEVCDDVFYGSDVVLRQGEESTFVFLVADDEGDWGVFAGFDEDVGGLGEGLAVWAGEVGEGDGLVGEDVGDGVGWMVLLRRIREGRRGQENLPAFRKVV
jgi:hypothetical protein